MNTETGEIYSNVDFQKLLAKAAVNDRNHPRFKEMSVPPTPRQMKRKPPRIARNETCPCGSGMKFKKCCLRNKSDVRFQ